MASTIETIQNAYAVARSGRPQQAVEDLQRSLRLHPEDPDLHEHLGLILLQLGQMDQAVYHLTRATAFAPSNADFHCNLAVAYSFMGKSKEAAESYRRALMFNAASFPAHLGLSSALFGMLDYDGAIASAKQAAQLNPRTPEPWVNLGLALIRSGRAPEGIRAFRDGIERAGEHAILLMNLGIALNHRHDASPDEVLSVHERLGRAIAANAGTAQPLMPDMDPDRPLRIGYLCPDFPERGAAFFIKPLLTHHDRTQFDVVTYRTGQPSDPDLAGLAAAAPSTSAWSAPDPALAQKIRADSIDILVCMSGHGPMGRIPLMAQRPAPVMLAYLGCPSTTGLKSIGHRITDPLLEGPESRSVEKPLMLDGCCFAYEPPADAPEVTPSSGGPVTFGCFAAAQKISEPLLDAWAAILKQVPGSRLLLKHASYDAPSARAAMLKELTDRGIDAVRIDIEGHTANFRDHLGAYARVDVALDTFPCGGMAGTCEALWMGVPVVSCAGPTHASRVGLSILTAAGLPELATTSMDGYVKTAAGLANDAPRRASMRTSMRGRLRGSALCDGAALTARLEAQYRALWKAWCGSVYYPET